MIISEQTIIKFHNEFLLQSKTTKEYLAMVKGFDRALELVDSILKAEKYQQNSINNSKPNTNEPEQ